MTDEPGVEETQKKVEEAVGRASSTDVKALIDAVATVHRDTFDTMKKADKRERLDLDVRGLIAMMSVLLAFGLAALQFTILHSFNDYPTWAAAIATGVTGFYFGSRGGSNGGANGAKKGA